MSKTEGLGRGEERGLCSFEGGLYLMVLSNKANQLIKSATEEREHIC